MPVPAGRTVALVAWNPDAEVLCIIYINLKECMHHPQYACGGETVAHASQP